MMTKFIGWQGELASAVADTEEGLAVYHAEFDRITEETFAEMWCGVIYLDPDKLKEAQSKVVRGWRDTKLKERLWPLERHAQEKALGLQTTLTEEEYQSALLDVQYLRDLPTAEGFPWGGVEDAVPWQRPEDWAPARPLAVKSEPVPEVKPEPVPEGVAVTVEATKPDPAPEAV